MCRRLEFDRRIGPPNILEAFEFEENRVVVQIGAERTDQVSEFAVEALGSEGARRSFAITETAVGSPLADKAGNEARFGGTLPPGRAFFN